MARGQMVGSRREKIAGFLERAQKLSDEFPEEALNNLRKFLEASLIEVSSRDGEFTDKGKAADPTHRTNNLMLQLSKTFPPRLNHYMSHIKSMGNYGSHFQEDGVEPSDEDIRYCIYAAKEVFQWLFPDSSANGEVEFIGEISLAVPCHLCGRGVGESCVKKSGEAVARNCEHTVRKNAFAAYRRGVQKKYSTTIVECFHEMVGEMSMGDGDLIGHREIQEWFDTKYPAYTPSSIERHAMIMATNLKTRLHHKMSPDFDYDLLFAEGRKFRLFRPGSDPEPL